MSEFIRRPIEESNEDANLATFRSAAREFQRSIYGQGVLSKEQGEDYQRLENYPMDEHDRVRILNEEKKTALHIPESMFMSERALELAKEQWSAYTYEFVTQQEMQSKLKYRLKKHIFFKDLDLGSSPNTADFIFAKDGKRTIAATAYQLDGKNQSVHVLAQKALSGNPGLGLGMLDTLATAARNYGVKTITLATRKRPLGLGNLGFEYEDFKGNFAAYYRLDLSRSRKIQD